MAYTIILDENHVKQLLFMSAKDSNMSSLFEVILNQILKEQADNQINAKPYERTQERKGYRNGTYSRKLATRVGVLDLKVPRIRGGNNFVTDIFARYQRSEQALLTAMMEMVISGVSTRKVEQIVYELCGAEVSKSTVSKICKRLDPVVKEWANRPLGEFPFVLADAMIVKAREGGSVRPRAVLIATGINKEGHREILGVKIGDSETEESWTEFFNELKDRGLHGVDLVVSDQHKGLVKSIQRCFQGATWQRCQTHFTRNVLDAAPKSLKNEINGNLRAILTAPDDETARTLLRRTIDKFSAAAPKAMDILEDGFEDATAVLSLPEKYRKRLRTTNLVERQNEEVRRRERVIRVFPNRDSAMRIICSVLMEIHEKWASGKKYLDMEEYYEWRNSRSQSSNQNMGIYDQPSGESPSPDPHRHSLEQPISAVCC